MFSVMIGIDDAASASSRGRKAKFRADNDQEVVAINCPVNADRRGMADADIDALSGQ